jgi:hypothetical protein
MPVCVLFDPALGAFLVLSRLPCQCLTPWTTLRSDMSPEEEREAKKQAAMAKAAERKVQSYTHQPPLPASFACRSCPALLQLASPPLSLGRARGQEGGGGGGCNHGGGPNG